MYTPINPPIFTAAYSGALSGMAVSGRVNTSPSVSTYSNFATLAGAFAQKLDTLWGVTVATTLDATLVNIASEGLWQGRAPILDAISVNPITYTEVATAIIAVMNSAKNYYSGEGIIAPPIPSAGGGVAGGGIEGQNIIDMSGGDVLLTPTQAEVCMIQPSNSVAPVNLDFPSSVSTEVTRVIRNTCSAFGGDVTVRAFDSYGPGSTTVTIAGAKTAIVGFAVGGVFRISPDT